MNTAPTANPANDIRPDGFFSRNMAQSDPAIAAAISKELEREKYPVEMIDSENIVSKAVLEAQGYVLTNKSAEGSPGDRKSDGKGRYMYVSVDHGGGGFINNTQINKN